MEFRTVVDIEEPGFRIGPCEEMLFVGSCFATEIGRRFQEEQFRVTVNPFGVMYNPASILHTIQRLATQRDGSFVSADTKEPSLCDMTQKNRPSVIFFFLCTGKSFPLRSSKFPPAGPLFLPDE